MPAEDLVLWKQKWLESMGLGEVEAIIDCDPAEATVEWRCEDGETITRTVPSKWTRVMGYHRPVEYFNPGKKSEYEERMTFREPKDGAIWTPNKDDSRDIQRKMAPGDSCNGDCCYQRYLCKL